MQGTSTKPKKRIGPTKNNQCWVCREPLDQPKKGRLRLTCSDKCRKERSRVLQGKTTHKLNREKKLVERRRSKPFIGRRFSKMFFEPVFVLTDWMKVYECLACGKPFDRTDEQGRRIKQFCCKQCRGRFVTRAYRARKQMGLTMFVRGRTGHRAALKAYKNRPMSVTPDTIEALSSGVDAGNLCSDSGSVRNGTLKGQKLIIFS